MASIREIFTGKVKWVRNVGWCDQPFVSISLRPVRQPAEQQIRFVKSLSAHADQNFLQIRQLLQQGDQIALGLHLPEEADKLGVRLRELGLAYSIQKERVYRPR